MNRMSLRQKLVAYLGDCKERWQELHHRFYDFWHREFKVIPSHGSASLDELSAYQKFNYEPKILRATQWSLGEEVNTDLASGVEVEVEFYPNVEFHQPDPYPPSTPQLNAGENKKYLSKDDVNHRITHFPPSHRLH